MDGSKHALSGATSAVVIQALCSALRALHEEKGVPTLDVVWLLRRCEDTQAYAGDLQSESLQVLIKDAEEFDEEFSGLLDPTILEALQSLRR